MRICFASEKLQSIFLYVMFWWFKMIVYKIRQKYNTKKEDKNNGLDILNMYSAESWKFQPSTCEIHI